MRRLSGGDAVKLPDGFVMSYLLHRGVHDGCFVPGQHFHEAVVGPEFDGDSRIAHDRIGRVCVDWRKYAQTELSAMIADVDPPK